MDESSKDEQDRIANGLQDDCRGGGAVGFERRSPDTRGVSARAKPCTPKASRRRAPPRRMIWKLVGHSFR